ncbi:hypothetical protein QAD02_011615 [Eretmocerus hayati]|uniref:Uncharacterized protein n=1 Tax=Eretmocerus hayati TaxID=131215 RepID=A0ACC2NZW9_9HYME|nr:hypothetical protein QAD02_011615 [Eretmocerus hayati]
MFRPISTLKLSKKVISELEEKGYLHVEDLPEDPESLEKLGLNATNLQKQLLSVDTLALDIWQSEIDALQESIPLCCSNLEDILGDGFQSGVITELSGVPFSGKTQICMQLSVTAQLKRYRDGAYGRVIYIDTRCGPTSQRFQGEF